MKRIAQRRREEETDPSVVPVVVVQASPEDVGSAARLDFYRQVLHQLRGHVAVRDRILNLPLARERAKKGTDPAEWLEMRDAVEFTSALKVLLERVPLQVDIPEMLMHWKWFGEWSIGCIGIRSCWVVETASTLCRAGETVLTLEARA